VPSADGLAAGGRRTTTFSPDTLLIQSPGINRSAPCKPLPSTSIKPLRSRCLRTGSGTSCSASGSPHTGDVPIINAGASMSGGTGVMSTSSRGSLPAVVTASGSPMCTRMTLPKWAPDASTTLIPVRTCSSGWLGNRGISSTPLRAYCSYPRDCWPLRSSVKGLAWRHRLRHP
jgi:hypothetical protein